MAWKIAATLGSIANFAIAMGAAFVGLGSEETRLFGILLTAFGVALKAAKEYLAEQGIIERR